MSAAFNERHTDVGNGLYFARVFGEEVRYVRERGAWYVNRGTYWAEDCDGDVIRLAKMTIAGLFEDLNDGRPREQRDALV